MQSMQVKEAPQHWLRWGSSFFLVRTSPQPYTYGATVSDCSSKGARKRFLIVGGTSQENETMLG